MLLGEGLEDGDAVLFSTLRSQSPAEWHYVRGVLSVSEAKIIPVRVYIYAAKSMEEP